MSIPKPGGGERLLDIPTVVDRFIQQAMMQVLQGHCGIARSAITATGSVPVVRPTRQ
ncbi:hypothetical protein [Escherichia coli]|uniref:hypothetical protein n=1 Tax=Escherichia coli TaxID=562 RepID=UPI001F53F13F|nr:hypothetical protein [Escherichia coli]MCI1165490.1 hypothetical protein [Escherichia coli]MCT6048000.1 hypothetical protein [Escherichia coli]MCT7420998.1 hypothetical protein [Escherichia coli]MDF4115077.1 hypothetical protein [Escherichia coli]MDS1669500.1 hypothetical protein [Escherichia coli]